MLNRLLHRKPTPAMDGNSVPRLGYLPALDGLRALAVLAVLFYHSDVLWLPGGFLGVEIFFVVSGYLITSLLLAEYRANNSIHLKQFWQRRARRLLPAVFAMILAVLVYGVIFLPEEVASLRGDVVAAFTYITNWYLIAAEKSYFEVMGRPSVLRHLWSLAVEEQFYLIWPLIFTFLLIRFKSRAAMLLLLLGATVSALWMGYLYHPDVDPSRVYYGTDTRAVGLLIGAALAFVGLNVHTGSNVRVQLKRWSRDLLGIAAFVGLVVVCLVLSEFDPFLYQGGMLLVGAATALVIAAVIHPQSPILAPILGIGILRWIGLRSYSLYLWHWPVFMVTRPQLDTTLEGTPLLVLRFALTFALAEISFRLIETPIRQGLLGKTWNRWHGSQGVRRWGLGAAGISAIALATFGLFLLGDAVVKAQPAAEPDYLLMTAEDEAVSFEEMMLEEQATPEDASAVAQSEDTPTDLSPVSYVILEPETGVEAAEINSPRVVNSWLRAVEPARPPVDSISFSDAESWRLRRDDTPPVANERTTCSDACQERLEFLQLKDGIVRGAGNGVRTNGNNPLPPLATAGTFNAPQVPLPPSSGQVQVLAFGDSVMLGASNYLRKTILDVDVDAKVGRQVSTAIRLLQERKDANLLPPTIIIHLGNNGTFSAKQFDEMMTLLSDQRVVFINTKVPRKWQAPNNSALVEGVQRYPNAVLVDWNNLSSAHADWFWQDGIHLRPEGAQVYAGLIAQVLNQGMP